MSELFTESFYGLPRTDVEELRACPEGPVNARMLRRVTLLTLREFLSRGRDFDRAYQHLDCYTWPDRLTVEMGEINLDPSNIQQPPGVFIRSGMARYERLAMGHDGGGSEDTSRQYLAYSTVSPVLIDCVLPSSNDCHDMAEMLGGAWMALVLPWLNRAGIMGAQLTREEKRPDHRKPPVRNYVVAMRIDVEYTPSIARSLESHRLRKIDQVTDAESEL